MILKFTFHIWFITDLVKSSLKPCYVFYIFLWMVATIAPKEKFLEKTMLGTCFFQKNLGHDQSNYHFFFSTSNDCKKKNYD